MIYQRIMKWAKRWHYPFLRIGDEANPPRPDLVVRHGKEHYEALRFVPDLLLLAERRIVLWNKWALPVRVDRAIGRVDALLSREQTKDIKHSSSDIR